MVPNIGQFWYILALSYRIWRYPIWFNTTISTDTGADIGDTVEMADIDDWYCQYWY